MTRDPLFEATRALRETSQVQTETERLTRQKILFDVRQRQRQRVRRTFLAIPLAALAVGSVAMAATRGYFPEPVRKWVAQVTRIEPRVSSKPKPQGVRSAPSPEVTVPAVPLHVEAPPPAPESASVPMALAPLPSRESPQSSGPSGSSNERAKAIVGDSPITEAEFQRYRLAHEAHFVKKDPAAALIAWNDYLAHAPSGRLSVEARYNQALCLLKLGRTREARRALASFVAGAYGSYRKQEAQALITTIDADAGL